MHANKNNELMRQGRISESIHPVYKWQEESLSPSPGAREAAPAQSSPLPLLPCPGRTVPMETSLGRRQGDEPRLPGLCLRDSPRLPPAATLRVPSAPRSRIAFSTDTLHGNLHNTRDSSIAAESGCVLPPKKKVCFYFFFPSEIVSFPQIHLP